MKKILKQNNFFVVLILQKNIPKYLGIVLNKKLDEIDNLDYLRNKLKKYQKLMLLIKLDNA